MHWAAEKGHADAIRALKEVGFTAWDAVDEDGKVRRSVVVVLVCEGGWPWAVDGGNEGWGAESPVQGGSKREREWSVVYGAER